MYTWFVYLHVLGVFGFLISHGVSIFVAFALRRERNLERMDALLSLSGSSIGFVHISILVLLASGILLGFLGHWWGEVWIWLSLGLLIAIYAYMGFAGTGYYRQVRNTLTELHNNGFEPETTELSAATEKLESQLRSSKAVELAVVGFGSLAVISWLMIFKPF
jgi:hypothetical protein